MREEASGSYMGKEIFSGSREVTQTFDCSTVRYFPLSEFRRVVEQCAADRVRIFGVEVFDVSGRLVEVYLPQNKNNSTARSLAYLNCFKGDLTLLFSATYGQLEDHGVSAMEML